MGKINPDAEKKIDDMLAELEGFAKPICVKLRKIIRGASPKIVEDWKWNWPAFDHAGIVCSFAAFKNHVTLFFHKGRLIEGAGKLLSHGEGNKGMAGIKFTDVKEVKASELAPIVRKAVALNAKGVEPPRKKKPPLRTPKILKDALGADAKADRAFKALSPARRREYIAWIVEAKMEATKVRRIEKMFGQLARGETLHSRYR